LDIDSSGTRARSTEWGHPPGGGSNQRPALKKLASDQNELIDSLRRGFESLEAIIAWCAKANIRTLGSLSPDFYRSLGTKLHVQWLTETQRTTRALDSERARGYRKEISLTVVRAADTAYRDYREKVSEYTDEKTPEVTLKGNEVAFRPALTELQNNQIDTLKSGLYGFDDRDAVARWERDLQEATFGEYAVSPDYPVAQTPRGRAYQTVCGGANEPTPARFLYLLDSVMPACIRGVRILRESAEEDVSDNSNDGIHSQNA